VDNPIVCLNVRRDDIGHPAPIVGQDATILEQKSTLQRADPV
jgi:hypothetical protein